MTFRNKLFRSGFLLLIARGINQACSFGRNVVVARIIGVENFGIAVTFSITVSIFDMLGSLSVDRLLIQAKDGDDPAFQATGHTVQVLRGVGSGLLIALFAKPLAGLFGIPQATWAFYYLALLPLIRGFAHLDFQRIQREMKYGPAIAIDIAQQAIPAIFAWPIARWTKDYSAMLWLVLLQGAIGAFGSFLVAERPYSWAWNPAYVKRFLAFGWPLIANAVLLFGIYDGDRFLIVTAGRNFGTHTYTMRDLGIYSVATSLTMSPMIAFSLICSALMLPVFSGLQSDKAAFNRRYEQAIQAVALISGFFSLPLILAGGLFVGFIYGRDYASAGTLIGWMAAAQALRMARMTPAMAAMSLGDTTNSMYSNMVRCSSLIFTAYVVFVGGSLFFIAISGFVGELLSLIVCIWKFSRDHKVSASVSALTTVILLSVMSAAGVIAFFFARSNPILCFSSAAALLAAFTYIMFLAFPELFSHLQLKTLWAITRKRWPKASTTQVDSLSE